MTDQTPDPWAAAAARLRERTEPPRNLPELAIEMGTRELQRLLDERGAAARELLAAAGNGAAIEFGRKVVANGEELRFYFDEKGLRSERFPRGLRVRGSRGKEATAKAAVMMFAEYGAGKGDTARVRRVADWFVARMDEYLLV